MQAFSRDNVPRSMKSSFLLLSFVLGIVCIVSPVYGMTDEAFLDRVQNLSDTIDDAYQIEGEVGFSLKRIEIGSAETRRYPFGRFVLILDKSKLEHASEYELTGLLAHELGHLEAYSAMNWISFGFFTVRYVLSDQYVETIEKNTDRTAVAKGFGEELLAYRTYRLAHSSGEEHAFLETRYLSPEEIRTLLGT